MSLNLTETLFYIRNDQTIDPTIAIHNVEIL